MEPVQRALGRIRGILEEPASWALDLENVMRRQNQDNVGDIDVLVDREREQKRGDCISV